MLFLFLYNLLMGVGLIVFAPFLFVKVILTPKYRSRFGRRLGFGLGEAAAGLGGGPRIWVHGLSVGEVASAKSLVRELRRAFPRAAIVFSATTASGERFARASLAREVDLFFTFPLDLYWSVQRVVDQVAPDLFVLVETDFWPNFLARLKKNGVPAVLVNGRISDRSLARYQRLRWFFLPLFRSFSRLAMQTRQDAERLRGLGVSRERLAVLGNLKYDASLPEAGTEKILPGRASLHIPESSLVMVAGSTHPGEEAAILTAFAKVRTTLPPLFLVLAPRDVARGGELVELVGRHGLKAFLRSVPSSQGGEVLVLDTLGELAAVYSLCDLAFIGGSLVSERGHNPLEAAVCGKPLLYGPSMEDFAEISRDLLAAGAAREVRDAGELAAAFSLFFRDGDARRKAGEAARALVAAQQGITERHIALLREVLQKEGVDVQGA